VGQEEPTLEEKKFEREDNEGRGEFVRRNVVLLHRATRFNPGEENGVFYRENEETEEGSAKRGGGFSSFAHLGGKKKKKKKTEGPPGIRRPLWVWGMITHIQKKLFQMGSARQKISKAGRIRFLLLPFRTLHGLRKKTSRRTNPM